MNDELVYDDFEEFDDLHELYDQREVASLETGLSFYMSCRLSLRQRGAM